MCKQETAVDETVPETSPDEVTESQPEEQKNCVENASFTEVEETGRQQLDLFSSTDNVDETEPENGFIRRKRFTRVGKFNSTRQ